MCPLDGEANGMSNGARSEPSNGVPNGSSNGYSNGQTNGTRARQNSYGGKFASLHEVATMLTWPGHPGYTAISSQQNPYPHLRHPYQPVGDFLSNVSRFQ